MDKLAKKLLRIANEKADPRSCLHHFAICENCGSRINILRLAEIINTKKSSKPSLNSSSKKDCYNELCTFQSDEKCRLPNSQKECPNYKRSPS